MSRLTFVGVAVLYLSGCDVDPSARRSISPERSIVIFSATETWQSAEEHLRAVFEAPVETPQLERAFALRRESLEEFDFFSQYGMVLFLVSLDRADEVRKFLDGFVSQETWAAAQRGDGWLVTHRDLWARPQMVGILAAGSRPELLGRIQVNGDALFRVYDGFVQDVLAEPLLRRTQDDLKERILASTGIDLPVPRHYLVRYEDPARDAVAIWKRRAREDLQLFAQLTSGASESGLRERCLDWRRKVVTPVYGGDEVRSEGLVSESAVFGDRTGVRLRGLWQNQRYIMGGPFETWCIPDPRSNRTLMLDLAVFSPDRPKMAGLRELQALASRVTVPDN